ncbi:MAG: hypothetical protein WA160_16555 [Pseudobdellovibrio sp.]
MIQKTVVNNFLILSVLLISNLSVAVPLGGSVSMATGGAGRGTVETSDGVILNPAIVAQLPTKYISFNYSQEQTELSISDNGREALFPAALAFIRKEKDNLQTQDMALAVAYSPSKKLSFGLSAAMVEYNLETAGAEVKYRQTVADLGMTYSFAKNFAFGIVSYKLASSKTDLSTVLQKQKTVGFGMNYTYQNFVRFRFDTESAPDNRTERLVYMGGIETFMNDWVVIRFGYQNNNVLSKNFTTAGLGFSGPQFGIHYAYLSNPADHDDDRHSVDLGIPF